MTYKTCMYSVKVFECDGDLKYVDYLSQNVIRVDLHKLSGYLEITAFATDGVLNYLDSIRNDKLFVIQYKILSDNGFDGHLLLDRTIKLKDVHLYSNSEECTTMTVKLKFEYAWYVVNYKFI